MDQIWKKKTTTKRSLLGDGREKTALEFEISNPRSNTPPCL